MTHLVQLRKAGHPCTARRAASRRAFAGSEVRRHFLRTPRSLLHPLPRTRAAVRHPAAARGLRRPDVSPPARGGVPAKQAGWWELRLAADRVLSDASTARFARLERLRFYRALSTIDLAIGMSGETGGTDAFVTHRQHLAIDRAAAKSGNERSAGRTGSLFGRPPPGRGSVDACVAFAADAPL